MSQLANIQLVCTKHILQDIIQFRVSHLPIPRSSPSISLKQMQCTYLVLYLPLPSLFVLLCFLFKHTTNATVHMQAISNRMVPSTAAVTAATVVVRGNAVVETCVVVFCAVSLQLLQHRLPSASMKKNANKILIFQQTRKLHEHTCKQQSQTCVVYLTIMRALELSEYSID